MKKHLYAGLLLVAIVLFPALQLDAQEEVLTLPGAEATTQSTRSFKKISLKPEFPYADGWLGGDGALSVQLSDTEVLWIFSDTYVSDNPRAKKRKKSSDMVANTIAISTFNNDQIHTQYYWRKSSGKHHPFFEPDTGSYKFWPVWAFYRNDTVFVVMSKVGAKENPDPDDLFNFRIAGTSLAVITNLDAEDPLHWNIELIPYSEFYPDETLAQAGTDENYLYVIKNFDRENFLTRISLNSLLSPRESIEYRTKDLEWKMGSTGNDRKIIFTEQANGSLEYYPELNHWIYVYGPNFLSNEIRYRFSKQITGPWSDSGVLYVTPEQTINHPSYDMRHFCYLARTHAMFYNGSQRKLLVTYDCNSTEFFHAAGSDFIYIPRVLSLDVPEEIE